LKKEYAAKHPGSSIENPAIPTAAPASRRWAVGQTALQADVVTMNQLSDIELLADKGPWWHKNWGRAPARSRPCPSPAPPCFLVRKGKPPTSARLGRPSPKKNLKNRDCQPEKPPANGPLCPFSAPYGYALKANNGDEARANDFHPQASGPTCPCMKKRRARPPPPTTFTQRNIGDVLITFENEANYVQPCAFRPTNSK
jgi:sulfate transport system substrate-binding protein